MARTALAARMAPVPPMAMAATQCHPAATMAKMAPVMGMAPAMATAIPLGTKTNMAKMTPIPGKTAPAMVLVFASMIATRLGTALTPVREMETVAAMVTTTATIMVVSPRF